MHFTVQIHIDSSKDPFGLIFMVFQLQVHPCHGLNATALPEMEIIWSRTPILGKLKKDMDSHIIISMFSMSSPHMSKKDRFLGYAQGKYLKPTKTSVLFVPHVQKSYGLW